MTPWPITTPRWPNPWNLSPQQERAIHLYSLEGTYKAVAVRMGLGYSTVNSMMREIRPKMKVKTVTRCAVLYALWRREMLGPSSEIVALMAHAPEDRGGTPAVERRGALDAGLGG